MVCLLLAGSAIATPVSTASAGGPVARAVLFYSPACQHCRDLIRGYLPSLLDEYGSRLQILSVNAADPAGRKLFQAAVTKFDVKRAGYCGGSEVTGGADAPRNEVPTGAA